MPRNSRRLVRYGRGGVKRSGSAESFGGTPCLDGTSSGFTLYGKTLSEGRAAFLPTGRNSVRAGAVGKAGRSGRQDGRRPGAGKVNTGECASLSPTSCRRILRLKVVEAPGWDSESWDKRRKPAGSAVAELRKR